MKVIHSLVLAIATIVGVNIPAVAQNIQLHHDFGRSIYETDQTRPRLTTTVEMFRPDRYGNTFFFVDMDYRKDGVVMAYWEIAREFNLGKSPFALHVEYDGGLNNSLSFKNAYLAGITYTWNAADYSAGFSIQTLYKYIARNKKRNNLQLTGVWYKNFGRNGMFSFNGFADLWLDNDHTHNWVFIAEPQLWLNLNKLEGVSKDFNLSIGTEQEISNNFVYGYNKLRWNPTLALKWTFK